MNLKHYVILHFLVFTVYASINETYYEVNQMLCNNLFPLIIEPPATTNLTIIDWDLQNFNDNFAEFESTSGQTPYSSDTPSFIAVLYLQDQKVYFGVTYVT